MLKNSLMEEMRNLDSDIELYSFNFRQSGGIKFYISKLVKFYNEDKSESFEKMIQKQLDHNLTCLSQYEVLRKNYNGLIYLEGNIYTFNRDNDYGLEIKEVKDLYTSETELLDKFISQHRNNFILIERFSGLKKINLYTANPFFKENTEEEVIKTIENFNKNGILIELLWKGKANE